MTIAAVQILRTTIHHSDFIQDADLYSGLACSNH